MAKDDAASGGQADEIESILQEGKKKELNFILMKSKGGVVMKCGPSVKGFPKLRAEAKEAGGMPAFSVCGRLTVSGRTMNMTAAEEEPPEPAMMRKLAAQSKKHFKALGIRPAKMIMTLPNGEVIDSDSVPEEDEEGEAAGAEETVADAPVGDSDGPQDPADALKAQLTERLKAIVPALRDLAAKGAPGVDRLTKAVQAAASEMAAGAFDRASKLVDAAEAGLNMLTGGPAPKGQEAESDTGLRDKLVQEFKEMGGDLRSLLQGAEKSVSDKATGLIGMFKSEIEKDLKKSGQILSLLRNMVATEMARRQRQEGSDTASQPRGEGAKAPTQGEGLGGPDQGENFNLFKKIKEVVTGKSEKKDESGTGGEGGVVEEVLSLTERISKAVSEGIGKAAEILKDNARLLNMASQYPEAALAVQQALSSFDETLGGDIDITPEVLLKASEDVASARGLLTDAEKALDTADKMKKGGKRNKAVKAAQKAVADAKAALAKAEAYEKAAKGKKVVEDAITTGPLSPNAPKKFSGPAALELIKGAGRDPDLTSVALESCRTGDHHESVAKNLGKVLDQKDSGFTDGTQSMSADYSAKYAERIVRMGGSVGEEYFARMDGYMSSGRQFNANPTGELPASTFGELEQKRSMAVGKALVKDDGTIDVNSEDANNAIGDALFNPDVLQNARPALTSHMLKTVDFLKDPANATKANDILKGVPEPTDPNAQSLVRRATGKGDTDPVGKDDVRNSVMASMLKPLDQGPVGSCFSTAPTRRMRETNPLGAMGAYAQIAGTGKYKPPFGPEVAVVTNTPPGDDPVMRSWEYSLATSTAQKGTSSTKASLASANDAGLTKLSEAISAKNLSGNSGLPPEEQKKKADEEGKKAALRLSKLKGDVAAAFTFVYDPMDEISDSNDGSSDRGRYILTRISPKKEIRTKDDFIAAMTEIALASLGIDKSAPDAATVVNHVKSDTFLNAVTQVFGTKKENEYLPWSLGSGGQTGEATQALHGDTLTQKEMTPKAGDPPPDEGARTKEVLKGFLTGMSGKTDEMVTIRTTGMHGFNALPNHPSLDKLKGDTQSKRDKAMEDNLLKPGKTLSETKIPAAKALELFMAELQPLLDDAANPAEETACKDGIAAHKPTGDVTSAELNTAIKKATKALHDLKSKATADAWKKEQTDKGKTVTDEDYNKQKAAAIAELETDLELATKSRIMNELVGSVGAPEFVIADTNWGSGADHTFFVMAPDPTTGEPALWQKTVPPGTLTKCTRDWIDAEWAKID